MYIISINADFLSKTPKKSYKTYLSISKISAYISLITILICSTFFNFPVTAMSKPEIYFFKDDGRIPNSKFPVVIYKDVTASRGSDGAKWFEKKLAENNWRNSWRDGVFPFHHYHSITHEVLAVYQGNALLKLGGESGKQIAVQAGDIVIIPAGVGHKCDKRSPDFGVVGAYPNGMKYDMNYGRPGERPAADKNIAKVPMPDTDPLYGKDEGLVKEWGNVK